MNTALFDTQQVVDDLVEGGFSEKQARAQLRVMRTVLEGSVATKADLNEVASDLRGEMKELGTELRGEMKELGTELRNELTVLRHDMEKFHLRTMIAVFGATGLLGVFLRFFPV